MVYLAIEIKGKIFVMNDLDELGGLSDLGVEHRTLGEVCDDQEYGDRCNTDCPHFCKGDCPAVPIRDAFGMKWHLKKN